MPNGNMRTFMLSIKGGHMQIGKNTETEICQIAAKTEISGRIKLMLRIPFSQGATSTIKLHITGDKNNKLNNFIGACLYPDHPPIL